MNYNDEELIIGKGDADIICDLILKVIKLHLKDEPDNNFDINKYIDIPISSLCDCLTRNMPFFSTGEVVPRLKCALDLVSVSDLTTKEGLKFKMIRQIEIQNNNACFLVDPRALLII
ncbi:MAG: hypothetical protein KIB43_08040 [Clostridium baratii]|uniref:hypothetical protein n=1 Tax=Clostridium baratii TaxID=1561 RepID=UPI00242CF8FB|nr:hypothetical protein [Clostridium baratii]MBS6006899.1 hypothetical protein [Clostridium baratii]MDU1053425.1 hypothetical protein [Clostridium baratii]